MTGEHPDNLASRWGFLERPSERLRYGIIASLIRSQAQRGRVVELGAGRGELLGLLDPEQTDAYVAVDKDADLLARIDHDRIPVERVAAAVEAFAPSNQPIAALVASEVLCYVEAPLTHLLRLWRTASRIDLVLVSSVLPRADKPNWQRGYDRVRQAIEATGWRQLDTIRIGSAADALGWEVVALTPGTAPVEAPQI
jgi:hypothetical protein